MCVVEPLQKEIKMHVYGSFIKKVPIFSTLTTSEIAVLANHLKSKIYLGGDTIFTSRERANCMYFIESGTVAIYTQTGKEVSDSSYSQRLGGQYPQKSVI